MLPEEKMFVVSIVVVVILIFLSAYYGYESSQRRKEITPSCTAVGGKVIESYDGTWVCIKSLKTEK